MTRDQHSRPSAAHYPASSTAGYRPLIGVLDTDGLHVTDRPLQPCPAPDSLAEAYGLAAHYDIRQLWITPRMARDDCGLPADLGYDGPIDKGMPHPWAELPPPLTSDPGINRLAPWMNVYTLEDRQNTTISVVLPHLDRRSSWHTATDGLSLLDGVERFRRVLGHGYYWSTNITASSLAKKHTRSLIGSPAVMGGAVPPVSLYRRPIPGHWSRPLNSREDGCAWIARYDANAAHLAPIGSANLGQGDPVYVEHPAPSNAPGYVRLTTCPDWPAGYRAWLPPLRFDDSNEMWIVTPLLTFMVKEMKMKPDQDFELAEGYLWYSTGRPYDGFYEKCKVARDHLRGIRGQAAGADLAYKANAALYKSFWGYLARTSGPRNADDLLWRPDHAHTIDTLSYVNNLRRCVKIGETSGRWPVAMQNDALYYALDGNDPVKEVPAGMRLDPAGGGYKPEALAHISALRPHCGEPDFVAQFGRHSVEWL